MQKLAAAVIEQGFVSEGGELLSRWVEAFPDAVAVDDVGAECDSLLWVRLPRGQKPEDLLGQVKRKMGCNAKVIALSDTTYFVGFLVLALFLTQRSIESIRFKRS